MQKALYLFIFLFVCINLKAQQEKPASAFTPQDTLRGSIGKGRQHWDVLHYDILVMPDIINQKIKGENTIIFKDNGADILQIDLQDPMQIDSIKEETTTVFFEREGNVYWLKLKKKNEPFVINRKISVFFQGKPKVAVNAPWDGGWIWKTDKFNNPWITVACQGLGASCWFPCKDSQEDEPDSGANIRILVPDSLVAISNGRMIKKSSPQKGYSVYEWQVRNPINNYNIIPYIGKYKHFSKTYQGLKGNLDMDFWVLEYNLEIAKMQFKDATRMMKAFEYWFGPYPFYEDGFKLVEAPHLGMEHQSAIAYGNQFKKGYLGTDLSGSGYGLNWDFIIVHESGHEWFGNNITSKDIADMWIHESFTNYSETLFTEYYYGKKAAQKYITGLRKRIDNDKPIIGPYGVNKEGSSDMYDKGGNMIHTIRQLINNDETFKSILKGLNKDFYHQTVTSEQIENYISKKSGIRLNEIFDQYLRTTKIPLLEYYFNEDNLYYKWSNTIEHFEMPVKVSIDNKKEQWIYPTNNEFKRIKIKKSTKHELKLDENFYIFGKYHS